MRRTILSGCLAAALALPVQGLGDPLALPEDVRFNVTLGGMPVGVLRLGTAQSPGHYAATARLETTGLARLLRDVRFEASVQGLHRAGRLQPQRYAGDVHTGTRGSSIEMVWDGGVPRVVRSRQAGAPQPWHLDPARQADVLDPMTVLLSVLADVPPEQACQLDLPMFDGRRRAQVLVSRVRSRGHGLDCLGIFRRVAGYSDADMAEQRDFPFRLTFAPTGNGMLRVVTLEVDGSFGTTRLRRQ